VEIRRIADVGSFSEEKMTKTPVFESPRMYLDVYALLPGQAQKVHAHADADKVYVVLEGRAVVEVGGETATLGAGEAVVARAGVAHGVRNDGDAPVRCLAVMAPRPTSSS